MKKYTTGHCPILNDECRIQITYIDASTLYNRSFVKDSFKCEHSIHTSCRLPSCPIYDSAPDTLQ